MAIVEVNALKVLLPPSGRLAVGAGALSRNEPAYAGPVTRIGTGLVATPGAVSAVSG